MTKLTYIDDSDTIRRIELEDITQVGICRDNKFIDSESHCVWFRLNDEEQRIYTKSDYEYKIQELYNRIKRELGDEPGLSVVDMQESQ